MPGNATTPTAEQPSRTFMRYIEDHATAVRRRVGVSPGTKLDPRAAADKFGLIIASLDEIPGVAPEHREWLRQIDARAWSGGMSDTLPDGHRFVILNPAQTAERAVVTTLEEVMHAYFGHQPSQLITEPGRLVRRVYDARIEQEAFWTAAAALLPAEVVARAVWRGQPAAALATAFGISTELVEFRVKTLGLWTDHRAHAA